MPKEKSEKGEPVRESSSVKLPAAVPKMPQQENPGKIKVTPENAALVTVQLLSEIRDLQARILKYFEEAANGRS